MKRIVIVLLSALFVAPTLFAGGIVTNTNQSAAWARYFSRYASTEIDAVYFNPAGLGQLSNGFHFSINNQSIWQTQTIGNNFPMLQQSEYVGDVKAPLFPSIYGAFKTGKWTFSVGFNPIGGGGGAKFDNGVPSFEFLSGVQLVGALNDLFPPTTAYSVDLFFEGTSVYYGIQAGVTYDILDNLSVAVGGRYVIANDVYKGSLQNLSANPTMDPINPDGDMISAYTFFTSLANMATQVATAANGYYQVVEPLPPADPLTDPATIAFLTSLGVYSPGMNNGTAAAFLNAIELDATGQAQQATVNSTLVDDQEVDMKKTGSGFAPLVSVHFSPVSFLDIALKYEFKTKLQLTYETTKDFLMGYEPDGTPITMFPDGTVENADIPALLSGGVNVRPLPGLQVSGGFEYYFDKNVNWDGWEEYIEANSYSINFSAQYTFGRFLISGSYGLDKRSVMEDYQDDLDYSLSSSSWSFGGAWDIMENVRLNAGYVMVNYDNQSIDNFYVDGDTQTFKKDTKLFAVGVDFSF